MKGLILFASVMLCCLMSGNLFSQDSQNITCLDNLYEMWHYGHDIAIQDTLAFVACGYSGVVVIDISDPENPEYVSNCGTLMPCTRISVYDNLLFVGNIIGSPQILDKSDIHNIVQLSVIEDISTKYADFYYRDGVLFISAGRWGWTMYAVDISDVENPVIITEFELCESSPGLFARGNSLFCISNHLDVMGWVEIDITNPFDPVLVDTLNLPNYWLEPYTSVLNEGNRVCISGYDGLWIIELDDSNDIVDSVYVENPNLSRLSFMALKDNILMGTRGGRLELTDISNLDQVEYLGPIYNDMRISTLEIKEELLYTFDHNDFMIVDINNPEDPRIVSINDQHTVGAMYFAFSGDTGYFINTDRSCRIVDLTNPESVVEISNCFLGNYPQSITTFDHGFITAVDYAEEPFGYEIFEPNEDNEYERSCAVELGELDQSADMHNIEVIGDVLYVLEGATGTMYASDITNTESPEPLSITEFNNQTIVNMRPLPDNQLIMLTNDSLFIVDVSDPASPARISDYEMQTSFTYLQAYGLSISYPYVYVSIYESDDIPWNSGLKVFDISDPDNIIEVNRYDDMDFLFNYIPDLYVSGDYLTVSSYYDGIEVLNVRDPENIHSVGYYNTPGVALYSTVIDNIIYTLDLTNVGVYDFSAAMSADESGTCQPTAFILNPAFPNPFNSSTTISFELPARSQIQLAVYDNLGREVSGLLKGEMAAGKGSVRWDAGGFVSGQYYCVLKFGGQELTQKLVLVK